MNADPQQRAGKLVGVPSSWVAPAVVGWLCAVVRLPDTLNFGIIMQAIGSTTTRKDVLPVIFPCLFLIYGCVMHFDIKNGKDWVQQNSTEIDVAEELMQLGVSRNDIVLGFQSPYKRPYTGFASQ